MTCAATMATASGITGFTLPGMMLLPGCSAGSCELGETRERPAVHPAQVVGDLHERDRQRAQLAGEFHRRILRAHGREVVRRQRERKPGGRAQLFDEQSRRISRAR